MGEADVDLDSLEQPGLMAVGPEKQMWILTVAATRSLFSPNTLRSYTAKNLSLKFWILALYPGSNSFRTQRPLKSRMAAQ